MILYSYFRSSAAYRVRIALALKHIDYETRPVHLLREGGEQHSAAFTALNPQGLVPVLVHHDLTITQSYTIIDYLEQQYPTPSVYPQDTHSNLAARAFAQSICCDIHPLNNLRVLQKLTGEHAFTEEDKHAWIHYWITQGFHALEAQLQTATPYCFSTTPSIADLCLIPQVYNALRFHVDMAPFQKIMAIYTTCLQHPSFQAAAPDNQPDCPGD